MEKPVAEMTVPELKELAARRQVEVVRRDGQEGEPLRDDFIAALTAAAAVEGDPQPEPEEEPEPVAFELDIDESVDEAERVAYASLALTGGQVVTLEPGERYETADRDEIGQLDEWRGARRVGGGS